MNNDPSPEDTLARKVDSPKQEKKAPAKILKNGGKKTSQESKIPRLSQRLNQDTKKSQSYQQSPRGKKSGHTHKRLTFKEPCRSEPRNDYGRGIKSMKEVLKKNQAALRPAGVPSAKNRWDADWMKLTKNDRSSSVPTRISRFTQKAPQNWRLGDTSTFEYDKPRIKRSGSRKSSNSEAANIYPDWWGDGSAYNSYSSSQKSRSRGRYEEDDFDRKVTFKENRKPILKNVPMQPKSHSYTAHPSDETPYEEASQTEEEPHSEETTEEKPRNRSHRQPNKPIISEKQKKGTIYSKLNSRNQNLDRNEAPVKTKNSKSGYAMTFSPTQSKNKKHRGNKENRQHNSSRYA